MSKWPAFIGVGVIVQEYVWVGQVLHIKLVSFFGFLSILHDCHGRQHGDQVIYGNIIFLSQITDSFISISYCVMLILTFFVYSHFPQKYNYLLQAIALYLMQNGIPKCVINTLSGFGGYLLYKNTKWWIQDFVAGIKMRN